MLLLLVDFGQLCLLFLELFLSLDELSDKLVDLAVLGEVCQLPVLRVVVLIRGLSVKFSEHVLYLNVEPFALLIQVLQVVEVAEEAWILDFSTGHLQHLVSLLIRLHVLLHLRVLLLVAYPGCHDRSQEDALVVGQFLGRQVNREQCFRLTDSESNEHNLFSLQVRIGDVEVHEARVASDHRGDLDREFVRLTVQVIVTEVEIPYARVPIQGIDQVARPLVTDPTVGDVEHAQSEAHEDKEGQLAAGALREHAAGDIQTCKVLHLGQLANDWVNMIVELDGTHQVDVCDLLRLHRDEFGKSSIEGLPEEVVGH